MIAWSTKDAVDGKENAAPSVDGATSPMQSAPRPSSPSSCFTPFRRRVGLVSVIILISASIALAVSGVFSTGGAMSEFDLFDPSTWLDNNPHGGNSPNDFNTWGIGRSCKGLDLQVINNLNEKWESYFQQSIDDWENGSPDVLTLNVRKSSPYDPECEPIQGVTKVCNGDYGPPNWLGWNTIVVNTANDIISSVAMMNDYRLNKRSVATKQHIMCHEIGHGFGLGHWDENYYNRGG